MIEKLEEYPLNALNNEWVKKINELVDAVNEQSKPKSSPRKRKTAKSDRKGS